MKKKSLLIGFGILAIGAALLAQAQQPKPADAPRGFRKANKAAIDSYVVLLRLRHDLFLKWKETGHWPDDKEANKALAGHGKFWAEQLKAGRALLAGGMKGDYWDNVALIVFEAKDHNETQDAVDCADDDPGAKGKRPTGFSKRCQALLDIRPRGHAFEDRGHGADREGDQCWLRVRPPRSGRSLFKFDAWRHASGNLTAR